MNGPAFALKMRPRGSPSPGVSVSSPWRWGSLLACLWALVCSHGVLAEGYAEFHNDWPAPVPAPGWSAATAVYSGHVDSDGSITDGTHVLEWSRIGQSVEGPTRQGTHFDLGEEITSQENVDAELVPTAAINTSDDPLWWEPAIIDPDTGQPSDRAFYIPHERRVYASAPGWVEITWYDAGGDPVGGNPDVYLISQRPFKEPVCIYWTDRYDVHGSLTPTGAPAIDVSSFHVVPHYHSEIPARLSDELDPPVPPNPDDYLGDPEGFDVAYRQYQRDLEAYRDAQNTQFLWKFGDSLRAQGRSGYVVTEFNADESTLIEVVVLQLRRYSPDFVQGGCLVGRELLPDPYNRPPESVHVEAYVSRGLHGSSPYAYQHAIEGPDLRKVYAIRPTTNDLQIEIFWQRTSPLGTGYELLWPYEMDRYETRWPLNPQLFVRGQTQDNLGRTVTIPDALHPELMPHQEFAESGCHASLQGSVVDATGEGMFLLRYNPGTPAGSAGVRFQVVEAVSHDDAVRFDLGGTPHAIGQEITDISHEGLTGGYIHVCSYAAGDSGYQDPNGSNDRYASRIYSGEPTSTGQILPVNTGMLEVWWSNLSPAGPEWTWPQVQWPSKVTRYRCMWTGAGTDHLQNPIVIGGVEGTGPIDPVTHRSWSIYVQNEVDQPGFNPNDEHALALDPVVGPVLALRNDLGSDTTSEPYVLIQYQDAGADNVWRLDVYPVQLGNLRYFSFAGVPLSPPRPLIDLSTYCDETTGVSGPWWESRKGRHWAMAAGPKLADPEYAGSGVHMAYEEATNASILTDPGAAWTENEWAGATLVVGGQFYEVAGNEVTTLNIDGDVGCGGTVSASPETPLPYRVCRDTADIVMHYYYPVQDGFFFPEACPYDHGSGDHVPWLDALSGTPGDTTFTIVWPADMPELRVGETLVKAKYGLPDVSVQASVDLVYQQSEASGEGPSAVLMDPLRSRSLDIVSLPPHIATEMDSSVGEYRFPDLPPHLYKRITYDGTAHRINLRGVFIEPPIGEYYLLPNVLTERDRDALEQALGGALADDLYALASEPIVVGEGPSPAEPDDTLFTSRAVSAGAAESTGYVTLAFQNNAAICTPDLPVSLAIIRVTCPLAPGDIKVIEPASPLYECLTLRHSGDFAGEADRMIFQWKTMPDSNGTPPEHGGEVNPGFWNTYVHGTTADDGVTDITISGPGLFTLTDNWFVCRYRQKTVAEGGETECPCGSQWSEWTDPQLAEGWIKRVIRGINPYEQRFRDLGDPTRTLNTLVTMISQAGPRCEGSIVLNEDMVDSAGLIEIYETLLDRGIDLSIDGTPAVGSDSVPGITNALLLAASRVSQLYVLLGNEAYADACDPTLSFGMNPSEAYVQQAPSIHAFMNQTSSLLEEELALLRGRDDSLSPGTRQAPIYNRLAWNVTSGMGEVAYALNYDIRDDVSGEPDGILDEVDARRLYPQGHGDAWGHYLTALSGYYQLLRDPEFAWIPRSEAVLVGGVPVTVDYLDERQFAEAAGAKARTGADIVGLTYRATYTEAPEGQWQGYKDSEPDRAWGLAGWGLRAGQAAYLDWVVANAILPASDHDIGWVVDDVVVDVRSSSAPGELPVQLFSEDFEGGTGNWTIDAASEWHLQENSTVTTPGYHSADTAMACNDEAAGVYAVDVVHVLELTVPLALPADAFSVTLSWWDVVGLRSGGDAVVVEASVQRPDETWGDWLEICRAQDDRKMWGLPDPDDPAARVPVSVSLDAYRGETVRLRFALVPQTGQPVVNDVRCIDRTTVPELAQIASAFRDIQTQLDNADAGLSPLGLAKDAVPFDIDPVGIEGGQTHFEQIYARALQALRNAGAVFDYASGARQMLQRQADTIHDFRTTVTEREIDFRNRLIELFGLPYDEDIGPGGTYPTDYLGPDVYHYMLVESSELFGVEEDAVATETFEITYTDYAVNPDGTLTPSETAVQYQLSTDGFGIVKPAAWSSRRAQGELQMAHSELIQSLGRFQKALREYDGLLGSIEDQAAHLEAQYDLNAEEIAILNAGMETQQTLNTVVIVAREVQLVANVLADAAALTADSLAEFLPTCVGFSTDATSGARGALKMAGAILAKAWTHVGQQAGVAELVASQAKELAQMQTNIDITALHGEHAARQQLVQLRQMIRGEVSLRYDISVLQEAMLQAQQRYLAALRRGERLLEDRLRFRRLTAAHLQEMRYKDMAFRIFRNDALQKYRAQFDLAARYVYLAARAYDYETNLLDDDARGPGSEFLTQIVRSRALGLLQNGQPRVAGHQGDPGLCDPMARMMLNWTLVLDGQLGFNNPQTETNRFSLRRELYHLSSASADDAQWRQNLSDCLHKDLLVEPVFRRHCRAFYPQQAHEPGLIIPFATHIEFGTNFFGLPLWGGDSAYDSTNFATKVRSVGVWFSNYNNLAQSGLAQTPRVYLVPIGQDRMRSPTGYSGETRSWTIVDQLIPVPFPITGGDLADPDWIPLYDSLTGDLAAIRRYASFRAYHDSGSFNPDEVARDSRLIGRSVWNTHWLLIIPAGTLHSDRNEAIRRFIYGLPMADGPVTDDLGQARDGNGISDIRLFFQTYAYSGAKKNEETQETK